MKKYFGTDGIRGKVGEHPITPEFMLKLGWAVGRVFANGHQAKVLIGKDTRISGYMFESALEAGLSAAGAEVRLLGPLPTPAIAYLTRTFHAEAGIVISASHNPYEDNGVKFFAGNGRKLPDEIEFAIEEKLDAPMQLVRSDRLGKALRVDDAPGRYIEFCKSTIAREIDFSGLKIVIDCAHGATYQIAPRVFDELNASVIVLGNKPDGLNINEDCGSTQPRLLQQSVITHQAHVGIAFDGDGDRVVMVDHQGQVVDGDELLFIIAQAMQANAQLRGGVVGTLMTNFGCEQALQKNGIEFVRAKVGDRYVMEELQRKNWCLGGESSGHIVCLDKTTTGDGIIAALQVLAVMVASGRSLAELKAGMHKLPQIMLNVGIKQRLEIQKHDDIQLALKKANQQLNNQGRVLLRASGTEPVIRVMVEGEDGALIEVLAQELADVVKKAAASSN